MKSLAYKIGLSHLVLTAFTVGIGLLAVTRFADLGGVVGRLLEENYRSVLAAENMAEALEGQEAALREAGEGDAAAPARFEEARAAFLRWYDEARAGAALPEEPALLDSVRAAYADYLAAADVVFAGAGGGGPGSDAAADAAEAAARLRALNLRLFDLNQDAMLATQARVERAAKTGARAVLLAAAVAVALSVVVGLRFSRRIAGPLRELTAGVRGVRRGHLAEKVAVATDDEVGELARAFNEMTGRLEAYEAMNVQALVAEQQKSASLVEAMPSPVVVTDDADRVRLLNGAALRLLAPGGEAWEGRPLAEVAPALARHLAAEGEGGPDTLELPLLGAPRSFRPRQTHVDGPDGRLALRITLLEDVTPFLALDRARSDFLAAVSHELRTPLTSLGVAVDLLLQDLVGPLTPEQRDLLQTAKADQDRLKRLVAGLVNLARLEAGAATMRDADVDLRAVAEAALEALRLPAAQQGVALAVEAPPALPPVRGDEQQLGWAVANLAGNALRHAPAGGRVTVRLRAEGDAAVVEVEDTGPGVPPEAVERIFEPFVQVEGAARPGSVGLGLAIARRVVEAHGGRIWAESRPGRGGFFAFTLPPAPGGGALTHGTAPPAHGPA